MSPLQYETFLQIADEALTEAIVTGEPPVVHRYRIHVNEFRVETLPKPEDRPGESFDYADQPFKIVNIGPIPQRARPAEEAAARRLRNPYPPDILPPRRSCVSRRRRSGPPGTPSPSAMHQVFRKGETVIKVRAARVAPEQRPTPSRVPTLTVAIGSSNFHGVELQRPSTSRPSSITPIFAPTRSGFAWKTSRFRIRGR